MESKGKQFNKKRFYILFTDVVVFLFRASPVLRTCRRWGFVKGIWEMREAESYEKVYVHCCLKKHIKIRCCRKFLVTLQAENLLAG